MKQAVSTTKTKNKPVNVVYSNTYKAKMKRIQRLPQLLERVVLSGTKRDLMGIQKIFHDGIKENRLGLERLAETTIQSKTARGFSKPRSPLYGKGDTEPDRSYSNMLMLREVKNGWKLYPSRKLHWSGKITLHDLFMIHEHGAIIKQKRGKKSVLIRIPPRPALLIAYRRWMSQRLKDKKEQSKEVRRAIRGYINGTNAKKLEELGDYESRESKASRGRKK